MTLQVFLVLSWVSIFAKTSTALPPPLSPPSLNYTTTMPCLVFGPPLPVRRPWPSIPWTCTIHNGGGAIIAIESYGRDVCIDAPDDDCVEELWGAIDEIYLEDMMREWQSEQGRVDLFNRDGVSFYIKQEEAVSLRYCELLMYSLSALEFWHFTTREFLNAGLLDQDHGTLLATFSLTFPWNG